MKTEVDLDIIKDPDGWYREWHRQRNAAVAALVEDGKHRRRLAGATRDEHDDDQARWLFGRQYTPEAERCQHDRGYSADAYLLNGLESCMRSARHDERDRLGRSLRDALKQALGDDIWELIIGTVMEDMRD